MTQRVELPCGCWLPMLAFFVACASAWVNHVVICIQEERWGFLIAGALAAPVGMIHGAGRWFGWW